MIKVMFNFCDIIFSNVNEVNAIGGRKIITIVHGQQFKCFIYFAKLITIALPKECLPSILFIFVHVQIKVEVNNIMGRNVICGCNISRKKKEIIE